MGEGWSGADPGLTVGGCFKVFAREILCATPTFGVISARVRMHVSLNFDLFHFVAS